MGECMRNLSFFLAAALTIPSLAYAQSTYAQPVREVESIGRTPRQIEVPVTFFPTCLDCANTFLGPVPEGKRFVIEQVSVRLEIPAGSSFYCTLGSPQAAGVPQGPFLTLETPRVWNGVAIISQQIRMAFDRLPLIYCKRNSGSSGTWTGTAYAGGYLVDKTTN